MKVDAVTAKLRVWLVALFIKAIQGISKEEDRTEVVAWLGQAREVVAGDQPAKAKFAELYRQMDTRKAVRIAFNGVAEGVRNYKEADLPLAIKVAVPFTLLAAPFIGGHGAGVAALGGAVGLPALLLIFLGTAGITAVLEGVTGSAAARATVAELLAMISRDEILRRTSAGMRRAMKADPEPATRLEMPAEEEALRNRLLAMDPFDFERHVMSFFSAAGMAAWVTKKSNDMGVDGFARHPDGLIVVQCKRYAQTNLVGRPAIQQFKGVIEENGAAQGFLVTTSAFTAEALRSAEASARVVLVGMDQLVGWHAVAPTFDTVPEHEMQATGPAQ